MNSCGFGNDYHDVGNWRWVGGSSTGADDNDVSDFRTMSKKTLNTNVYKVVQDDHYDKKRN